MQRPSKPSPDVPEWSALLVKAGNKLGLIWKHTAPFTITRSAIKSFEPQAYSRNKTKNGSGEHKQKRLGKRVNARLAQARNLSVREGENLMRRFCCRLSTSDSQDKDGASVGTTRGV